ncbi:VOC family protein [Parahaliea mediterranea]|uniref:VOC family protein n=1 Tax=Parahaliea mediterranea TaxID=651086 RepID=UPI000E2E6CEA|nr:VOC family protein [Parahaliea mediterranea]
MADKPRSFFTKLIVGDEERMAAYYMAVYGLQEVARVAGDSGGLGEPFREVILGTSASMQGETLVMFNFLDRPKPRDQQVILGFVCDDLEVVRQRILDNGGSTVGDIKDMPEHGVRVLFATDPEGALSENVQLLGS